MIVKIGPGISGLCPPLHFADTILANPSSKFKLGEEVTCMVLSLDPAKKKITLTHKKTLLQSDLPKFSSLNQMSLGGFPFIPGERITKPCKITTTYQKNNRRLYSWSY